MDEKKDGVFESGLSRREFVVSTSKKALLGTTAVFLGLGLAKSRKAVACDDPCTSCTSCSGCAGGCTSSCGTACEHGCSGCTACAGDCTSACTAECVACTSSSYGES